MKLKKLLHSEHPQHMILGTSLINIGLVLIFNDCYFFWPPFAASFLNDDLIGGAFVVVGILLINWALSDRNSVAINHRLLTLSCGFLAFEITAELSHYYVAGKPHMLMAGVVEFSLLLFAFSIIKTSKKHD